MCVEKENKTMPQDYDTPGGGWKRTYRRMRGKLCVVIVVLIVVAILAVCDSVFLGVWFGTSHSLLSKGIEHRFCIEARGFNEFGEGTNDPEGLAVGHLTVHEETGWVSWRIKYQLSEPCGLIQWHIHGPIGTDSPNAGVFRELPSLPFGPADELDRSGVLKGHLELTKQELYQFLREPEAFYLNFHSAPRIGAEPDVELQGEEYENAVHNQRKRKTLQEPLCYPGGAVRAALNKICPSPDHYFDDDDDHHHHKNRNDHHSKHDDDRKHDKGVVEDDDDDKDYHKELHNKEQQSHDHYDSAGMRSSEQISTITFGTIFLLTVTMLL